jgi:hypothetical protein
MTLAKAIVIGDAAADELRAAVAALDLPRRAISLPIEPAAPPAFRSFIELWGECGALREAALDWPFPVRAWLVTEHVPLVYDRSCPSGEASPGMRMISTIHRRDGMSLRDFAEHWLGPHTSVAKSYTVPVWHYNQNVVVEALTPGSDESPDGFVGMHFESAEAMRSRWQDHPAEAARGAGDAARFMNLERSVSFTAIETVWENAT